MGFRDKVGISLKRTKETIDRFASLLTFYAKLNCIPPYAYLINSVSSVLCILTFGISNR